MTVENKMKRDREKQKRRSHRKKQTRARARRVASGAGGNSSSGDDENETELGGDEAGSNFEGRARWSSRQAGNVQEGQSGPPCLSLIRNSIGDECSGASTQQVVSSSSGQGHQHPTSTPRQDKWYSLYAVVIREGDSGGTGGGNTSGTGSQTVHSLLLRPEEVSHEDLVRAASESKNEDGISYLYWILLLLYLRVLG